MKVLHGICDTTWNFEKYYVVQVQATVYQRIVPAMCQTLSCLAFDGHT